MAEKESTMLALGTPVPEFRLSDPDGREWGPEDFADAPALLLVVMCNHCPYVKHLKSALAEFARSLADRGLATIAINPNDPVSHPADAAEGMAADIRAFGYDFPYVIDAEQKVAKALRAICTPEFFLFDRSRRLAYRGQYDDSRPGNGRPLTGDDLRAAVDAVLAGRGPSPDQKPALGCSIKWRPGNAPDYAG